jgi:integrase
MDPPEPIHETEPLPRSGSGRKTRRVALTDRRLDALCTKRLTKAVDLTDTTVRGLVARIQTSGGRSFYFRWRVGDVFRRVRLDAATVEEARQKAAEARAAIAIGRDPTVTKAVYSPATAHTVVATIRDYVDDELLGRRNRDHRYVENVRAIFANHVEPHIGHLRLIDLTHADLSKMFTTLLKATSAKGRGEVVGPVPEGRRRWKRPIDGRPKRVSAIANRVHTQVMGLLRWAEEEGRLPPGAAPKVRKPIRVEPSNERLRQGMKRVLRLSHLVSLWKAVEDEPEHVRVLVRLLLLLPLRRQEVTELEWVEVKGLAGEPEIDSSTFGGARLDLPASRMKGKRPHLVPLPSAAAEMLRDVARNRGNAGPYLFSVTSGQSPFAGWQSLVHRLRRRCPDLPTGWTIHDLRTGIATAMGEELDIDEMLIARLLAHSMESRLGVTWRYDQSRRIRPMLEALTKWEVLLMAAVEKHGSQPPASRT